MRDYYMKAAVEPSGNSQSVIARLKPKDQLKFIREPNNPDDRFAVRIETMDGETVGYVAKIYSQRVSITMTHGFKYRIFVAAVTKGKLGAKQYGLDLQVMYTVPDLSKLKRKRKVKK